jgi:hypothetical protein
VRRPSRHLALFGAEVYFQALGTLLEPRTTAADIGAVRPGLEVSGLLRRGTKVSRDVSCSAEVFILRLSMCAMFQEPSDDLMTLPCGRSHERRAERVFVDVGAELIH